MGEEEDSTNDWIKKRAVKTALFVLSESLTSLRDQVST